jgi:hypothetical protein
VSIEPHRSEQIAGRAESSRREPFRPPALQRALITDPQLVSRP